eukprot:snap_masked-scaffold_37-processed-gene-0.18-mRNA-1 protein AED:1.00 eAED:1.00 QI:0/0/0/0/1/1/2/0/99
MANFIITYIINTTLLSSEILFCLNTQCVISKKGILVLRYNKVKFYYWRSCFLRKDKTSIRIRIYRQRNNFFNRYITVCFVTSEEDNYLQQLLFLRNRQT